MIKRTATLLLLAMAQAGCGFMVQRSSHEEYTSLGIRDQRGELNRYANSPFYCDALFLKKHWGAPNKKEPLGEGSEIWTYDNGLQWAGFAPWIIIPIPLFVPVGVERIHFGVSIPDGKVFSVTHDTARRDIFVFPFSQTDIIASVQYTAQPGRLDCRF